LGAIQQINNLDLGALELGWVQSVRVTPVTCAAIKDQANLSSVAISVHAPYFINLNADNEEWPKSRKRLMDSAHFGNLAGATDIVFHPGSYFNLPPSEVRNTAIPRLNGCVEELRNNGNPVTLRPETMGKSAMLGSLEDVLEMSREIQGVLPCFDFAHLHARAGNGSINSEKEWAAILDSCSKALGDNSLQKLHIHLSGIEYTSKGEKNHLPLRESDFDYLGLMKALKTYGCSGRILCESPVLENDALLLQQVWREN